MVYMRTMIGIDLVKSLVNFFFKIFDGYITGSLGPAGSQIRKIKILDNFRGTPRKLVLVLYWLRSPRCLRVVINHPEFLSMRI